MKKEEIMERMGYVLHGEYLQRVRVFDNENAETVIKVKWQRYPVQQEKTWTL